MVATSAPPSPAAHLAAEVPRLLQGLCGDVPYLASCPPFIRAEAAKVRTRLAAWLGCLLLCLLLCLPACPPARPPARLPPSSTD
jgi:hypothetical protein